jgi:hypothetical protein
MGGGDMATFYNAPDTGKPSEVSFDGMHYEFANDDWQSQDARQENHRWQHIRYAAHRVVKAVKRDKR